MKNKKEIGNLFISENGFLKQNNSNSKIIGANENYWKISEDIKDFMNSKDMNNELLNILFKIYLIFSK